MIWIWGLILILILLILTYRSWGCDLPTLDVDHRLLARERTNWNPTVTITCGPSSGPWLVRAADPLRSTPAPSNISPARLPLVPGGADEARKTVRRDMELRCGCPAFLVARATPEQSTVSTLKKPGASCTFACCYYSCHVSASMHLLHEPRSGVGWSCLSWIDCLHMGRVQIGPKQKFGLGQRLFS
jgi:hypothetical protein